MTWEIFSGNFIEYMNTNITTTEWWIAQLISLWVLGLFLLIWVIMSIIKANKDQGRLSFDKAFKYPFKRARGMRNILWILIPIIGWFALGGYIIKIVKEFLNGKFEKLPLFQFKSELELWFFMFIKSLPFWILYIAFIHILTVVELEYIPLTEGTIISTLNTLFSIIWIPLLTINFFKKQTVKSFFEFKIIKYVFKNFGDYMLALLKSALLGIIFFIMIIILVWLPANVFTKHIFIADFYRRIIK